MTLKDFINDPENWARVLKEAVATGILRDTGERDAKGEIIYERTDKDPPMARIVADLTFLNWDVAAEATDKLRELDYEVVIDPEQIDLDSNAVFAKAYKVVPRADKATINACFHEVNAVMMPLYGNLNECGEAD